MKKGICDCGAEVSGKAFCVCLKIDGKVREKIYYALCPKCCQKVVLNEVKAKSNNKKPKGLRNTNASGKCSSRKRVLG